MPPQRTAHRAAAAILALAALAGCGAPSGPAAGFPAPGELQVVAIRPVAADRGESLLPNGSFEDFYAGAFAPTGPYIHPAPDLGHSAIRRADAPVADGRFAVAQQWTASDWQDAVDDLFGAEIGGLRPNTFYTFSAQADPGDGAGGTIMLYYIRDAGGYEPFHEIEVPPGPGYKTLSATFNTGPYTRVRVATLGPWQEGAYPSTIHWDDWRLARATGGAADAVGVEYNGLIPNGSFETWFSGSPAPVGGFVPPREGLGQSSIRRESRNVAHGSVAVHQVWEHSDQQAGAPALFGIEIANLSPNTRYRFAFKANTLGEYRARIVIFGFDPAAGAYAPLESLAIPARPGYKDYAVEFYTGDFSVIRIAARGPGPDGPFPNRVLWDAWELHPAGETAE